MNDNFNHSQESLSSLASAWMEQRKRLEGADILNRQFLLKTISDKSFWLAPKPRIFYIIFVAIFAFALWFCLIRLPQYWPVAALCLFGIIDTTWQVELRNRIRSLRGGVIGMQRNLLLYRRIYIWASVAMWIVMFGYLWWFYDFINQVLGVETPVIFFVLFGVVCLFVFLFRTMKTFRSLGDLQNLTSELRDLE